MEWLTNPYLNLPYIAARLYGHQSRLYTRRLQLKLKGVAAFETWEQARLEMLKRELTGQLNAE